MRRENFVKIFVLLPCLLFMLAGCSPEYVTGSHGTVSADETAAYETDSAADSVDDKTGTIVSDAASADYFENPVEGATGWAAADLPLYETASADSAAIQTVSPGTAFVINSESDDFWQITTADGYAGYIQNQYCMINLPDVLPDIQYDIVNAYAAIYRSSGYDIDNVTGAKLYDAGTAETYGEVWNERLQRYEYLVPVIYATARKIAVAQYNAYKVTGGRYCLKIYDAYRPHCVTVAIYDGLQALYSSNDAVRDNIDYSYGASGTRYSWGASWFLAGGVSTHNTGSAIDVTLCEWDDGSEAWTELSMPTDIHELSVGAIKYYSPSEAKAPENYAKEMNGAAILLDTMFIGGTYEEYSFESTGMATLASEWWHFQDDQSHSAIKSLMPSGCDFQVTECLSYAA